MEVDKDENLRFSPYADSGVTRFDSGHQLYAMPQLSWHRCRKARNKENPESSEAAFSLQCLQKKIHARIPEDALRQRRRFKSHSHAQERLFITKDKSDFAAAGHQSLLRDNPEMGEEIREITHIPLSLNILQKEKACCVARCKNRCAFSFSGSELTNLGLRFFPDFSIIWNKLLCLYTPRTCPVIYNRLVLWKNIVWRVPCIFIGKKLYTTTRIPQKTAPITKRFSLIP